MNPGKKLTDGQGVRPCPGFFAKKGGHGRRHPEQKEHFSVPAKNAVASCVSDPAFFARKRRKMPPSDRLVGISPFPQTARGGEKRFSFSVVAYNIPYAAGFVKEKAGCVCFQSESAKKPDSLPEKARCPENGCGKLMRSRCEQAHCGCSMQVLRFRDRPQTRCRRSVQTRRRRFRSGFPAAQPRSADRRRKRRLRR